MLLLVIHLGRKIKPMKAPTVYGIAIFKLATLIIILKLQLEVNSYYFTEKLEPSTLTPGPIVEVALMLFM